MAVSFCTIDSRLPTFNCWANYPYLMAESKNFEEIVAEIRAISARRELILEEIPAPQKLAPYAFAMTADTDDDVATARFVLLHDPAGQEGWGGYFRCVTFVRAAVDHEMASDPMVANVGWSWLIESLEKFHCAYVQPSGTVTRVTSASFGTLDEREDDSELEVRASWTPTNADAIADHVRAWLDLLEHSAGLEPIPEGVTPITRSNLNQ
jgi:Protein of unknown function (DUF3000)